MKRNFFCYVGAMCLVLGLAVHAGDSVILPDPSAPKPNQPQVVQTGSGLPQVNIATPNGNGLSYNRYQQFDVGRSGAILNNSNKNVNTQLGGWIERNPNIVGGMANLIVNEVNSSRPSQLNGYIEIAGQRADVVIANPSGINVSGGGFINANRSTLTTGIPVIQNGQLAGYEVRGGQVNIMADGYNNRGATFTDIIAHSVNINSAIHANQQINVVTGDNFVSRDTSEIMRLNPDAETGVSLDVSAIGGMYANQIRLVGTGRGVGVNSIQNAGEISAAVGEVIIGADGMLSSSGIISGHGGVRVDVDSDITNTGVMQSGANFTMLGGESIFNDSSAGSGEIIVQGDTTIYAQDNLKNTGLVQGLGSTDVAAIDGPVKNSGSMLVGENLKLYAGTDLINTGSIESGDGMALTINAGKLENSAAAGIVAGGKMDVQVETNIVNAGRIHSDNAFQMIANTGTFGNSGRISGGDDGYLYSFKDMANSTQGEIVVTGSLTADTEGGFVNNGTLTVGKDFTLNADMGITNTGGILAGNQALSSSKTLYNTGLIDGGEVVIKVDTLTNVDTGSIFGDHIAIQARVAENGITGETGAHAPVTHTRYDPDTDTYYYNEDGGLDADDSSIGFDWETASQYDPDVEFGDDVDEDGYTTWEPEPDEEDTGDEIVDLEEIEIIPPGEYTPPPAGDGQRTTTGNAGVIAARNRLDIGFSGTLLNFENALVFSGGDTFIGGYLDDSNHAAGTGGDLRNSSAVIDVGGSLTATLNSLTNYNAHYTTEERLINQFYYNGYRFVNKYRNGVLDEHVYIEGIDHISKGKTKRGAWKIVAPYDEEDFFWYQNIRRQIYDQFIIASRPAFLTAGGDITITGDVTNNRSTMAAGNAMTISGNLLNIRAEEALVTRDYGNIYWSKVVSSGSFGKKHKRKDSFAGVFNPGSIIDFTERDVTLFGDPDIAQPNANPAPNIISAIASGASLSLSGLNENLYLINRQPDSRYIIESNPRFTDYRNWTSSDFMVQRLNADPENTLKRLGDGYYEQRLIRDQIINMTGARYLDGFTDDEDQYAALMLAGVDFAEEFDLEIGVTLTASQMARLTSDIVWLEYVTVDTPDGPVQALTPIVYLAPGREILLASGGGIISGREVSITGELKNAGNILGTDRVTISGTDLSNGGSIAGGFVSMAALRDINNVGGAIIGQEGVDLQAGRDINLASATYTTSTQNGNQSSSRTEIGKVATVMVTSEDGSLSMRAGNDITLNAAAVESAGSADIAAGNDLIIGGVTVSFEHETGQKGKNYIHERQSEDIGSLVYAAGDMKLSAGNDISVAGSTVVGDSAVNLSAGNDVTVTEGRSKSFSETTTHEKSSGFLSSKTKKQHEISDRDFAIGSEISGNTVNIETGGDFALRGSTVAASEGLDIAAGGDIDIAGADNFYSHSYEKESKRSGPGASFSGTGVGISYGKTKTRDNDSDQQQTITGSMVGSLGGDVNLYAGRDLDIAGSQVMAGTGDITISGENVTITNQYEQYDHSEQHKYEQSGISLSLGLTGPVANAVQSGMQAAETLERAQNASTGRAEALFGIAAARQAYDTGKEVAAMANGTKNPAEVGLSVNLGYNKTKSESTSESHDQTVVGSLISSGGDTTIIARGRNGEADTGDLAIIGSEVHAGGKVILDAANDIILKSAEETHDFASSNKSNSFGVGVGINIGAGKEGKDGKVGKVGISASVNANASTSQGSAEGSGTRHIETIIQGDKGVDFTSGNDTTLKGAQIIGEQITGNVGGDLAIISEQDTYNESRNQDSKGGSISIGSGLGSISGSYNQQTQKGNADYASVNEQSGIYAGDGGFDITVGDNTGLTGAVIASTADPEDNKLTTGTLTTEDINNSMSYDASTKGIGGEFTYVKEPGIDNKEANKGSISPGLPGKETGDDNSTTKSAVAEGSVTITDEDAQLATTGETADETIASLNRDTDNAHNGPLERPPSLEELLAKQAELIEASAAAGKAMATTVGDISNKMLVETLNEGWAEGGVYKSALQALGSALIAQLGNGEALNAALGTLAGQLAAKNVRAVAEEFTKSITDNPGAKELLTNLVSNILSTAIGTGVGGESGANFASIMDRYNRQLHYEEINYIQDKYGVFLEKYNSAIAEYNELHGTNYLLYSTYDAKKFLAQESLSMLDHKWSKSLVVADPLSPEYLLAKQLAYDWYDVAHKTTRLFTNDTWADYYDSNKNVESLKQGTNYEKSYEFYLGYVEPGITNFDESSAQAIAWYANYEVEMHIKRRLGIASVAMIPVLGQAISFADIIAREARGEEVSTYEYAFILLGQLNNAKKITGFLGLGNKSVAGLLPATQTVKEMVQGADGIYYYSGLASTMVWNGTGYVDMAGSAFSTLQKSTALAKYVAGHGMNGLNPSAFFPSSQALATALAVQNINNRLLQSANNIATSPLAFDHFIGGEINRQGKATGAHSLLSNDVRLAPSGVVTPPNAHGVYEAVVQVFDSATQQWITKTSNGGKSTMFPKDWSGTRIKLEVQSAWDSPTKELLGTEWTSYTASGVKIKGFVDKKNGKVTAFPVFY